MSRRHVRFEILELEQVGRPTDRPASFAVHASPDRTEVLSDGQTSEPRECARGRTAVGIDEHQPARVRDLPSAEISCSTCAQHTVGSQHGNAAKPGCDLGGSVRGRRDNDDVTNALPVVFEKREQRASDRRLCTVGGNDNREADRLRYSS
jgi:hypothetical protein